MTTRSTAENVSQSSPPLTTPQPQSPLRQNELFGKISPEDRSLLKSLLNDLDYLERLKYLDQEGNNATTDADHHIVPITGLFLSCLARMLCELETALEVWDRRV